MFYHFVLLLLSTVLNVDMRLVTSQNRRFQWVIMKNITEKPYAKYISNCWTYEKTKNYKEKLNFLSY